MKNNMKHLKKYNESRDVPPVDIDYIKSCFVEFIDIPGNRITENLRNFCYIYLREPKLDRGYKTDGSFSIDEYINSLAKHNEFYLEVENCIDKVKIKYPNYKCDISLTSDMGGGTLNLRIKDSNL